MNIQHNVSIKASASNIYNALSTEKGITGWWAKKAKVGTAIGASSHLTFNKQGTIVEMGFRTVLLENNKKVVWKCTENANPAWIDTNITTEITDCGDYCKINFSHSDFDAQWENHDAFIMTKGGWNHFISSLIAFCEKGEGQPW